MADVDQYVEAVVVRVLERDGVRVLGGDPLAAEHARERVGALEAKLALAADQFADDHITADQLRRINERVRPELEAERGRLRAAMPDESLGRFGGTSAADAWAVADVETRRKVLDVLGVEVTILPVGAGRGRTFEPESVQIEWKGAP